MTPSISICAGPSCASTATPRSPPPPSRRPITPRPIDIAVLDYHLGAGQFGTEVAAKLRTRRPEVPIIIMSATLERRFGGVEDMHLLKGHSSIDDLALRPAFRWRPAAAAPPSWSTRATSSTPASRSPSAPTSSSRSSTPTATGSLQRPRRRTTSATLASGSPAATSS